jgi:hypothetical protein
MAAWAIVKQSGVTQATEIAAEGGGASQNRLTLCLHVAVQQ